MEGTEKIHNEGTKVTKTNEASNDWAPGVRRWAEIEQSRRAFARGGAKKIGKTNTA